MAKLNFIFQAEFKDILDSFSELFGGQVGFSSFEKSEGTDFSLLVVGKDKNNCRYCNLLRDELGLNHRCVALDKVRIYQARESRTLVSYSCHGGMNEAIVPVCHLDKVIGVVFFGQVRTVKKMPRSVERLWRKKHGNQRLKKAFDSVPWYSQTQLGHILKLFSKLVQHTVTSQMVMVKEYSVVDSLITYMDQHPELSLSLSEAAEFAGRSPSALSHLFKRSTNKSFKRYQIENKIAKANDYFVAQPELTVNEVAHRLGYHDAFHFSKLYKKYTGTSPSKARAELLRRHAAAAREAGADAAGPES